MSHWKEEIIFQDGGHFFDALCSAIDAAKKSVELETYIFERDKLGNRVLRHLVHAAQRGVRVRLLLDGVGCSGYSLNDFADVIGRGVETRFYHPLPWQNPFYRVWRFLSAKKIVTGIWKLNRRNHRKTCIVDGQVAFLGGMNVSDRHISMPGGAFGLEGYFCSGKGHSCSHASEGFRPRLEAHDESNPHVGFTQAIFNSIQLSEIKSDSKTASVWISGLGSSGHCFRKKSLDHESLFYPGTRDG